MFDIISIIREKVFRRPKLNNNLAGEELSEKQTTKLGYFLLFCMFLAIMVSAQWTLSTIEDLPDRPKDIPYCVTNVINTFDKDSYYYSNNYYDSCDLTSTNPKFDFNPEYTNLKVPFDEISIYKQNISSLETKKSNLEQNLRNNKEDYNTSLIEKIADENGIYDKNNIKNDIQNNSVEIGNIENEINIQKSKIDEIITKNKTNILTLKQKLDQAENDYKTAYILYKLYVAILSFVFAITVFFVLYKMYTKRKILNSPNTIIFSIATFAYGLVLLQIAVMFIWDIIPHKLLKIIIEFFSMFTPLLFIVQFLWPILIVAIFGFLVYRIQKRLYSPTNVLKRFVMDKKCPNCGNGVDFTKPFCPLCSNEIQIHCPNCKKLTLKGMPYCSECGGKLT